MSKPKEAPVAAESFGLQVPVAVTVEAMPVKSKAAVAEDEPEYGIGELAANAGKLFGVHRDIAMAALRMHGLKHCGVEKAKGIIKDYTERKLVK